MASSKLNHGMLSSTHWSERNGAKGWSAGTAKKIATRPAKEPNDDRRREWLIGAAGVVAALILVMIVWRMLPPPQMKTDEEVFKTVDALFTAVTSRDMARLDECEQRLRTYQTEGRTSPAVASRLDAIVKQARNREWEPAAKKLYTCIMGQRGKT